MAEYIPVRVPGAALTSSASGTITGGQLLIVSGSGTVAASTAATAAWLGVAAFDAVSGDSVTVHCGGTQEIVATGTVTAGQAVEAATAGTVATHTNGTNDVYVVGVALTTATNPNKVRVQLTR